MPDGKSEKKNAAISCRQRHDGRKSAEDSSKYSRSKQKNRRKPDTVSKELIDARDVI